MIYLRVELKTVGEGIFHVIPARFTFMATNMHGPLRFTGLC